MGPLILRKSGDVNPNSKPFNARFVHLFLLADTLQIYRTSNNECKLGMAGSSSCWRRSLDLALTLAAASARDHISISGWKRKRKRLDAPIITIMFLQAECNLDPY